MSGWDYIYVERPHQSSAMEPRRPRSLLHIKHNTCEVNICLSEATSSGLDGVEGGCSSVSPSFFALEGGAQMTVVWERGGGWWRDSTPLPTALTLFIL